MPLCEMQYTRRISIPNSLYLVNPVGFESIQVFVVHILCLYKTLGNTIIILLIFSGVIEEGAQKTKDSSVSIKVYKTKSRTMNTVTLPRMLDRESEVVVDGVKIDVLSGSFHVSGSLDELAEKIVLVFVVFQLHFMAVKDDNALGDNQRSKYVVSKNPYSLAIGAMVEMPCQHYLTDYFTETIFNSQNEPDDIPGDATAASNSRQSRAARMATFMRSDTVESEGDCLESFFLHIGEDDPPSYSTLMGSNQAVATPDESPRYSTVTQSTSGSYHGSQTFYIGDAPEPNPEDEDSHLPTYESLGESLADSSAPPTYSAVLDWVCALPNPETAGALTEEDSSSNGNGSINETR